MEPAAPFRSVMTLREAVKVLLRFPYLLQHKPDFDRLLIGCGTNPLPGWINTDLIPAKGVFHLDATRPLGFAPNSLRYVACEHMIEHLPYESGLRLLQEIYRVLGGGGKIRVATPNFAFLARLYQEPDVEYIEWAANFVPFSPPTALGTINNFVRHWGHKFIWDIPSMKSAVESVGFEDVREFRPGESDDPVLRGIEGHGKVIGERWNMLETFVIEATKPVP